MRNLKSRHLLTISALLSIAMLATVAYAANMLVGSQTLTTFDSTRPATFTAPHSVNEGSSIALSFSGSSSSFEFAFDCGAGAGFSSFSTASSQSCPTVDNGSRNVAGQVRDDSNAITTYSSLVQITNVAPSVSSPGNQTATVGVVKSFNLGSFLEPGANDNPWGLAVRWSADGSFENLSNRTTQGSLGTAPHTYTTAGTHAVTVRVTDKDGGVATTTFNVTVSAAVSTTTTYYLHHNPAPSGTSFSFDQATNPLTMNTVAPTYTGTVASGRLIAKDNDLVTQSDKTKVVVWRTTLSQAAVITKAVTATPKVTSLYAHDAGLADNKQVHLKFYLRDCPATTGTCTTLASARWERPANANYTTATTDLPWASELSNLYTVNSGRVLELRVIVPSGAGDVRVIYDTVNHPAHLIFPL